MNIKKDVKFDTTKLVNNLSKKHIIKEEDYNTDRNRIKGYKDIL